MRNRLWVIILLVVWLGQWQVSAVETAPRPSVSEEGVWTSEESLAALVEHQAHQWLSWSPQRSRSRARHQRRGVVRYRRAHVVTDEATDEERAPKSQAVFEPQRWGLSPELSQELPERLKGFCQRYYECFKTKTRNMGAYVYPYLSGLLRLESQRHYRNIGRATGVAGENIQHFASNSPWPTRKVLEQVQGEIKATPGLQRGGMLLLDESANEAGKRKAGAGRQYNGRLGKVDLSQVGVFLAYANLSDPQRPLWTWIEGELYLPEHWLSPEMMPERQRVGIPLERKFETKIELGYKMIQRVKANGLSFEAVACDDLYGQSPWLRDRLDEAQIVYMADVPRTTQVYLHKPVLGVPEPVPGRRGPKPTRLRVLNGVQPLQVHQVARHADTTWQRVRVRPIERGALHDPFAARRVWTLREGETEPVAEWLVIRQEAKNRYNYALSNAPANASLQYLAWLKCQRYFVERANQDAKSEAGWDELQAQKYRGWEHHLALVVLLTWFVAQIKWEWGHKYTRDPALAPQFAVEVLPALSMANIRLLLRAAMPLPQPSPEEAVALVVEHLVNRTRSRSSRLKRQQALHKVHSPP